jgi:hypothetical protein
MHTRACALPVSPCCAFASGKKICKHCSQHKLAKHEISPSAMYYIHDATACAHVAREEDVAESCKHGVSGENLKIPASKPYLRRKSSSSQFQYTLYFDKSREMHWWKRTGKGRSGGNGQSNVLSCCRHDCRPTVNDMAVLGSFVALPLDSPLTWQPR